MHDEPLSELAQHAVNKSLDQLAINNQTRLEQLESIDNQLVQILNILESIRENVIGQNRYDQIHCSPITQNFVLAHIHVIKQCVLLYKRNYVWSAAEIRKGVSLEQVKDVELSDFKRINCLMKDIIDKWM